MKVIDLQEHWVETPRAHLRGGAYAKKKYKVNLFDDEFPRGHITIFDTKKAALNMIDATVRRYKRQGYEYKVYYD